MITRRAMVALGLLSLSPLAARGALAAAEPAFGPSEPMDFGRLRELARTLRDKPYVRTPEVPAPEVLDALTYGPLQEVAYRQDRTLFLGSRHPVSFFHLGKLFRRPVAVYALEGGEARAVRYDRDLFRYPDGNPAAGMPDGAGFAGFRVQNAPVGQPGDGTDWVAFLGASYFRAAGDGNQYGVSGRGLAIDTAPMPGKAEEFPDFTRFYVSPFEDGAMTVLALMESRSVTGAYRFVIRKEPRVAMDVDCTLFFREGVDRLGIAPLTSMMWFSEGISRYLASDWRPEVHDSDGLLLHTGRGELAWRPLNNPPVVSVSAFADRSPRGFGLLQRDRDFRNYIDDGYMENRPNLWVVPKGDWGAGSVQLVEIPAFQEYDDNIVAMWVPDDKAQAGQERSFAYALLWPVGEPVATDLARCVATRASKATWLLDEDRRPGRPNLVRQFALEYEGRVFAGLDPTKAEVVISLSRGVAGEVEATWAPYGKATPWRVFFRVYAEGPEPVEIRMFLRQGERALTETWLYQYYPEQKGTAL